MSNRMSTTPEHWKAYPPQIDRVEMSGDYGVTAGNVRAFLWRRLEELGEKPYIRGRGILCSNLHNAEGTHALKITQRGHSIWVRGSLSKWGGRIDEFARSYLPASKVGSVVRDVLDRLDLPADWVRVHLVEMGVDILVEGAIGDYTPHLRTARGQRRKQVQGGRTTHYQGSTRKAFKVYDKGKELGLKLPAGVALLRMELTLQNGAASIGKVLGLGLPLHASDLGEGDTMLSLINNLHKMIDEVSPTGALRATGATKDVPLETAINLLLEAYGDDGLPKLIERIEEMAEAEADKQKRKRIRDSVKGIRERYSKLDAERFTKLRETIAQADMD